MNCMMRMFETQGPQFFMPMLQLLHIPLGKSTKCIMLKYCPDGIGTLYQYLMVQYCIQNMHTYACNIVHTKSIYLQIHTHNIYVCILWAYCLPTIIFVVGSDVPILLLAVTDI